MREMKDSGVDWMGKIPSDWSVIRFKEKYVNEKEIAKDRSSEFERLALTLNGVIKRPKDDSEGLQPKEFDSYQILHENNFIFKMIDLQNVSTSRVGLSPFTGLVSPAYIRFAPRQSDQYSRFVYYYLMSLYYNCVYNNIGANGVRSALNAKDMGEIKMPFPKDSVQRSIGSFLDKKHTQIAALIANVQSQIEKLKAYKQSLITEVVTKGLNSTVQMKDSGVDWIGSVPRAWRVAALKYFIDILPGYAFSSNDFDTEGGIPLLRGINVTPNGIRWDDTVYWNKDFPDYLKPYRCWFRPPMDFRRNTYYSNYGKRFTCITASTRMPDSCASLHRFSLGISVDCQQCV